MIFKPRILIVGGGAGGLLLAVRLGNQLGAKQQAEIILVNDRLTHVWKPLLHEVAAGTLNAHEDELSYLSLAKQHHFHFEYGTLLGLNRIDNNISIALENLPRPLNPIRVLSYDILLLAIGSVSNTFNIEGALTHCYFLDSLMEAENFQHMFLTELFALQANIDLADLQLVIVGAGATGVELAAELHYAVQQFSTYTERPITPRLKITLIESGPRILSTLPEKVAEHAAKSLAQKHIKVLTNTRISKVTAKGLYTVQGDFIKAELKIWAAGIKGAPLLTQLGLSCNQQNQILVNKHLQTLDDPNIFAFGDCAACPLDEHRIVPQRAQAAHQEAQFLAQLIPRMLAKKSLPEFHYQDHGSLLSLSRRKIIGQVMLARGLRFGLEGHFARWVYRGLYKRHQFTLLGFWKTLIFSLAQSLTAKRKVRLKLH